MVDQERTQDRQLLEAAQLLLKDVRRRRLELDRRERDLQQEVASYKARLGVPKSASGKDDEVASLFPIGPFSAEEMEAAEETETYGAIGEAVKEIVNASHGIDMAGITAKLESRRLPIRAKSYLSAARTAVRRLRKSGDVRARNGRYFPKRNEAQ